MAMRPFLLVALIAYFAIAHARNIRTDALENEINHQGGSKIGQQMLSNAAKELYAEDGEGADGEEEDAGEPEEEEEEFTQDHAITYLQKYGYLTKHEQDNMESSSTMESALKRFQRFFALSQTGHLDAATIKAMQQPRCGHPDMDNGNEFRAVRPWRKRDLTWRLRNYPRHRRRLPNSRVNAIMRTSLERWRRHTPLRIKQIPRNRLSDLDILFGRRSHGDRYPFDGRGKVLAHAFFPGNCRLCGDNHFDDDEHWASHQPKPGCGWWWNKNKCRISLEQVAIHEFGHALGLGHSRVRDAIMFPSYRWMRNLRLHRDDIAGIKRLYPRRSTDEGAGNDGDGEENDNGNCRERWVGRFDRCILSPRPTTQCICLYYKKELFCDNKEDEEADDAEDPEAGELTGDQLDAVLHDLEVPTPSLGELGAGDNIEDMDNEPALPENFLTPHHSDAEGADGKGCVWKFWKRCTLGRNCKCFVRACSDRPMPTPP